MNTTNNFDFLRLLFAVFVIISHSYILSGAINCDWLCQATNGQIFFSLLGLNGFFVLSGYLVFQSLERSKNFLNYYWKRILRIFPGLFVALLLTVLLAAFLYTNNDIAYLKNISIWTYIPNNLSLYHLQYSINGVFEDNPFKSAINGSLWTLAYEFTFYILLSVMLFFKPETKRNILIILCLFLFVGYSLFFKKLENYNYILSSKYFFHFGYYFVAGSLLAVLDYEKFKNKNILLAVSLLLFIISLYFHLPPVLTYLCLPIIIITLGLMPLSILASYKEKVGDLSYGVYIYAFPVQQTLVYYFRPNPAELIIYSTLISLFIGYFSWNIIEKRFLKLKNVSIAGLSPKVILSNIGFYKYFKIMKLEYKKIFR